MSERYVRQRSGAKAVEIDNRAQVAKVRLLLFLSLLISAGLALALTIFFAH
jgi:hypothetical protein